MADAPVRVALTGEEADVRFEVTNRGSAIEPSALGQIFDPLRRGALHRRTTATPTAASGSDCTSCAKCPGRTGARWVRVPSGERPFSRCVCLAAMRVRRGEWPTTGARSAAELGAAAYGGRMSGSRAPSSASLALARLGVADLSGLKFALAIALFRQGNVSLAENPGTMPMRNLSSMEPPKQEGSSSSHSPAFAPVPGFYRLWSAYGSAQKGLNYQTNPFRGLSPEAIPSAPCCGDWRGRRRRRCRCGR